MKRSETIQLKEKSSLIKTECDLDTQGDEIVLARDMAVETQSMLDDNEEHQKLYSEVHTTLLSGNPTGHRHHKVGELCNTQIT